MYIDRWWNVSVISICIVNNAMTITQRKWNRLPLLARLWARLQHGLLTVQYAAIYGNLRAPINKIGYDGDKIGTAAALDAIVHDAIYFIKRSAAAFEFHWSYRVVIWWSTPSSNILRREAAPARAREPIYLLAECVHGLDGHFGRPSPLNSRSSRQLIPADKNNVHSFHAAFRWKTELLNVIQR